MEYLFKTQRLGFRPWRETDLESLAALNADPVAMEYFPVTLTRDETAAMIARFSAHFEEHGYCFFPVDLLETGECIGFIGLSNPRFESYFTPCVEIGWRLSRSVWGKGLATEGALGCLEYAFSSLDIPRIYSFTSVYNHRSQRVMIKAGMEKVGEFDHPSIPEGHWLQRHVLYCLEGKK